MYSNIKNAKIVIKKCEEDPSEKGNVVTEAIAKILLAYNGAVAADVFGNTPYSQTGILNPDGTPMYMQPKNGYTGKYLSGSNAEPDDAITLTE